MPWILGLVGLVIILVLIYVIVALFRSKSRFPASIFDETKEFYLKLGSHTKLTKKGDQFRPSSYLTKVDITGEDKSQSSEEKK